jgi:hypothetical protein
MFLKNIFPKRDWPHLFKNQLSWFLVPLILLLWILLPFSHNILTNTMIAIAITGIIESIFYMNLTITSNILNIIGHISLLIPIILIYFPYTLHHKIFKNYNYPKTQKIESILVINKPNPTNKPKKSVKFSSSNKYYYNNSFRNLTRFNIWSFILLVIANIVIIKLPYWPYNMRRNIMMLYYNFIVISIWLLNFTN